MLASATAPYINHAQEGTMRTVQGDVGDLLKSGNYYMTDEIAKQLYAIDNGLEHIKLDQNLLRTSKEWASGFDPNATKQEQSGAMGAMQRAQEVLHDYKNHMSGPSLQGRQENEIRERHHWAAENLAAVQQNLAPYTMNAHNRINQFSDHIGVTDRYTGYRHNLNRGSRDPFKLGLAWMDTKKNTYNASSNIGWRTSRPAHEKSVSFATMRGDGGPANRSLSQSTPIHQTVYGPNATLTSKFGHNQPVTTARPQVSGIMDRLHARNETMVTNNGPPTQCIQEACGINMTFPGKTEYMKRFKKPPPDTKISPFIVNPCPDFTVGHGRPLMSLQWDPSFTEYQTRYEWPDSAKIVKLPWLRK